MIDVVVSMVAGILNEDGTINNEPSIKRLAEVAVAYGKAGKKSLVIFINNIFNKILLILFL